MATVTNYTTLLSEIDSWSERTWTTGQKEGFIQVFETEANILLGPDYRRTTTITLTTDDEGVVSLPSGFVTMRSLVRDVSGSAPLVMTSWDNATALNPYADADDPTHFAISGTELKVMPIVEGDFTAVYDSTLSAITSSNTTNWLLTACPNAYLFGCLSAAEAFNKNLAVAATWMSMALDVLARFVGQGVVAQFSNVQMSLPTPTP